LVSPAFKRIKCQLFPRNGHLGSNDILAKVTLILGTPFFVIAGPKLFLNSARVPIAKQLQQRFAVALSFNRGDLKNLLSFQY
jgi:hypothetical protein